MARFRWRAPYFMSVPSRSNWSLAVSVSENTKGVPFAELKMRCCNMFNSRPRILRNSASPSGRNTTTLSILFMNSGENLRRAASTPAREIFSARLPSTRPSEHLRSISEAANPKLGRRIELISPAPKLLVMKIMAREKSTRRLSPNVSVALSKIPSSKFHSESLAFSISSNSTKLSFILSV